MSLEPFKRGGPLVPWHAERALLLAGALGAALTLGAKVQHYLDTERAPVCGPVGPYASGGPFAGAK